jgi:hypothetical protein
MAKKSIITVKEIPIKTIKINEMDFICITDIAKQKNSNEPKDVVKNWMRLKNTLEYLGLWETLNNPIFKGVEFDPLFKEAGSNAFTMSPTRWVELTGAIGIHTINGAGGGTYAQRDIAFKFSAWVSVEFELYLIKEFQRLKEIESSNEQLQWNFQRYLSKVNYTIHTDAIKENLLPQLLDKKKINLVYASEADILNVALFGKTAKEWRDENPSNKGNIIDYATIEQLVVLSNLESLNAVMISQNISQQERLVKLNETAISQMKALAINTNYRKLK